MAEPRNRALSIIVRIAVCVILLGSAAGLYTVLVVSKPSPERSDRGSIAPRVLVMPTRSVEVSRQWEGFGTVVAMDSADVPARVTATVVEVPTEVLSGAWVEPGQLLVRLDDSDFQRRLEISTQVIEDIDAQLARIVVEERSWTERLQLATDQVALAQDEFQRVLNAMEQQAAKQREVDQAKQSLISAIRDETVTRENLEKLVPLRRSLMAQKVGQEAQKRLNQQNVERCVITSPITGVIQSVDVEVGENLTQGNRVARVVDLRRIEVPLRLAANARESVRTGDEVILRSNTGSRTWSAAVSRIAPEDDQSTRTMTVFVELEQNPSQPGSMAPGQFLRGTVISSNFESRVIVPRRAVDGDRILLVEDGHIEGLDIDVDFQVEGQFGQFGLPDREWVVMRGQLPNGKLVVINPSRSLTDGRTVDPAMAGAVASVEDDEGAEEIAK